MAPTLQGLPPELLLNIVEWAGMPTSDPEDSMYWDFEHNLQLDRFRALRATCTELNAKLVYFFGSKFLKEITAQLSESGLEHLQEIFRSAIGVHVRGIRFEVFSLFSPNCNEYYSRLYRSPGRIEDADDKLKWRQAPDGSLEWRNSEDGICELNESFANFVVSGSLGRVLTEILRGFCNIRSIEIEAPAFADYHAAMSEEKLEEIQGRWQFTSKVLLKTFFTELPKLEELSVYRSEESLALPLSSVLDTAVVHLSDRPPTLQKLHLDVMNDLREGNFPMSIRILNTMFLKLENIIDLALSLKQSPSPYFEQLAEAFAPLSLKRLSLGYCSTSFTYFDTVLGSCKQSLQSFSLESIHFDKYEDFQQLLILLIPMKLRYCAFNKLNVGSQGLHFDRISVMRPKVWNWAVHETCKHATFDGCDWNIVFHGMCDCEIIFTIEADIDVGYWLKVVGENVQLRWKWPDITCYAAM